MGLRFPYKALLESKRVPRFIRFRYLVAFLPFFWSSRFPYELMFMVRVEGRLLRLECVGKSNPVAFP